MALEYTGRLVLTHKDFLARRQIEISRVQALTGDGLPWVTGRRTKQDGIFEEDPVTELSGIGDEKAGILKRVGDVTLVSHVALLLDKDIKTPSKENGLNEYLLWKNWAEVKAAASGGF